LGLNETYNTSKTNIIKDWLNNVTHNIDKLENLQTIYFKVAIYRQSLGFLKRERERERERERKESMD
jgi:lipoate synthase